MLKARTVANSFIDLARQQGRGLTPMQLLKLVYLAHGYNLAIFDEPLIANRIEAWQHGPVIPDLYHAIKHHRNLPVALIKGDPEQISDTQNELIQAVYRAYGDKSGGKLSDLTHAFGTPWHEVYDYTKSSTLITDEAIKSHYKDLISDD